MWFTVYRLDRKTLATLAKHAIYGPKTYGGARARGDAAVCYWTILCVPFFIPYWLVLAEIMCTVHVALAK